MPRTSFALLALAALIGSGAAAQGQAVPLAPRITIGPFVGMNYTTFYGSDVDEVGDVGSRWDFTVGGKVDFGFSGSGMFRTGLLYSGRGASSTEQGVDASFKLRYIELPLLFGYKFPATGARPYIIGGGQVGFKTGCQVEGTDGGVSASVDCDELGGDFASTDFGLVGGGGLIVPMGRNDLTFDLRYVLGMTRIEKESEVKNRGFTFGVGLMVPIAR